MPSHKCCLVSTRAAIKCQLYCSQAPTRQALKCFHLSDCHVSEKRVGERVREIVISERDPKYVHQVPLNLKMPVGCLGAPAQPSSPGSRGGGEAATIQAERMELMQQTLLIQIFRVESPTSLSCSTCASFSRTCCQAESGWQVLSALVATNSRAVWSPPLTRAVNSLRLQVTLSSYPLLYTG